jgi:carbon storage regulator
MLVLTRKARESVVVGGSGALPPLLTITVLEIEGGSVRLGFQADEAVSVHRSEVWQRLHANDPPASPPPNPGSPDAV